MLNLFSFLDFKNAQSPSHTPSHSDISESTQEVAQAPLLDSELPPYRVIYKRVKYPRISIKADLSMIVSVPPHFPLLEIQAFISRHKEWIIKTTHKLKSRHLSLEHELSSHKDEILLFGIWQKVEPPPSKAMLKASLQAYIAPRLEYFATLMNLTHQGFTITNAQSRFGSCTYDNRLFFSLMLIFASKELIDYVIVHELAHIVHKNHSKAFWELLERYCPHCKDKRRILRHEARLYPEILKRLNKA